jgi:chaperonin GroES
VPIRITNLNGRGHHNGIPSTARPRSGPPHRGRGKDRRRHHHPRQRQGKAERGEIVAVGSGTKAEDGKVTPLDVKSGDRVLFGKWSGTEVKLDGEDLLIMKESDIMGIVG